MSNKKTVNISVVAGAAKNRKKKDKSKSSKPTVAAVAQAVKSVTKSMKAMGKNKQPNSIDNSNYKAALMNPFSKLALGARLPDEFSLPTATYHMHGRMAVQAVGTSSNCSFMFSGQPFQTFMCGQTTAAQFSASALSSYAQNATLFYATTETTLATQFSSYRIVSSGVKIRGLQPLLGATGRIIVARVPVNTQLPGPTLLSGLAFSTPSLLLQNIVGIPLDSNNEIPVNILELPESGEFTLGQLATGEIAINNRICSSDAYRMHSTLGSTVVNTTQAFGMALSSGDSYANTSASTESFDTVISAGQTAILVRCEGLPPGANADARLPVLDVEFIIHVEGVPTISTSSSALFVPATMQAKSSPAVAQRIIAQASQAPMYKYNSIRPSGGRY